MQIDITYSLQKDCPMLIEMDQIPAKRHPMTAWLELWTERTTDWFENMKCV